MADPTRPPEGYDAMPTEPPKGYEPVNAPGVLESIGRGAAEGATFGFDDKLGLDKQRRELSRKTNPWAHFLGELMGGFVPMVGAGGIGAAAKGANLVSKGLRGASSLMVPGEIGTLGQAVGQGAKVGATYGALSGAGHADVKDDDSTTDALAKRAMGAGTGLVVGAPLGGAFGAAGHGVYRGAQALGGIKALTSAETDVGAGALTTAVNRLERDRISPSDLIAQIRAEFPTDTAAAGGTGMRFWGPGNLPAAQRGVWTPDMVEDIVKRAMLGEDASTIATGLAKNLQPGQLVNGKGPGTDAVQTMLDELATRHLGPLNLVDRASMVRKGAGDNTQMTMRAAAATPGEHLGIIREGLLERQTGATGRLQQLIERAVGSPDLEGAMAAQRTRFQNAARELYTPAFAEEQAFNLTPLFNRWQQQFDGMRGVIPDTIRSRLNQMMWTGTDAAGNTVRTPPNTLQGFMFAREGLRDMINELPQGNNLRRYLSRFYDEATDVVAATNPKWKTANDFYAEGRAVDEAVDLGKKLATRQGSPSREALTALAKADKDSKAAKKALSTAEKPIKDARKAGTTPSPDEQAAFDLAKARFDAIDARQRLIRTAYAQNLTDDLLNKGETHDLVRKMLLPGSKNIIGKVMGDDAPVFIKALEAEAAMHRTYKSQFGSQTTPLREHVDELNFAPSFEAAWSNLGLGKILQLAQEYAARTINSKRNTELMKLYSETDPVKQMEFLRAAQQLYQARSRAGNAAGLPVVGSGGPAIDAVMGDLYGMNYSAPRTPARTRE